MRRSFNLRFTRYVIFFFRSPNRVLSHAFHFSHSLFSSRFAFRDALAYLFGNSSTPTQLHIVYRFSFAPCFSATLSLSLPHSLSYTDRTPTHTHTVHIKFAVFNGTIANERMFSLNIKREKWHQAIVGIIID